MPRGGSRPGAGRKVDPNSKQSQARAAREAKALARAVAKDKPQPKAEPATDVPRSYAPDGKKASDAPETWPFGVVDQKPAEQRPEVSQSEPDQPVITGNSPLEFLLAVMRSQNVKLPIRMQAAALAAPYEHAKPAPLGKKEGRDGAAKKVAQGKFAAAAAPPRLVSSR